MALFVPAGQPSHGTNARTTGDELIGGCKTPKDVESLYSQMLQHMINCSLGAEMQAHLGYEQHESANDEAGGNRRNGESRKQVQSAVGKLQNKPKILLRSKSPKSSPTL